MDLNPNYSQEYLWGGLGFAHFNAGNFDMAIKLAREALDRNDRALYARLMLACALVRAGRPGEAAWEIEQVRLAEPNYTLSVFARSVPLLDPRSRTQWVADLRTAGLPE
jgi:tetratricopeptide (TPR) repeat protein